MTVTITGNGAITGLTSSGISSADSIGFTQSGTGAVARTAQGKLRELKSIEDFGAVGDGVTNDTTAVQTAFTWLAGATTRKLVGVPGSIL